MADAEGYRESDASPASSEILRSIIFNKLPLLNSPGELVPNTLYYDAQNSSVQPAEQTNYFARDRIAFNNKNFGSTPTVHIPNVFFNNTSFVVMELEIDTATWDSKTEVEKETGNECYLPHGWGFAAIGNIVYYLGSSSVANIQISGISNLIFALGSCETAEKKNLMLTGGGKYINAQDVGKNSRTAAGVAAMTALSTVAVVAHDKKVFRNILAANTTWNAGTKKWTIVDNVDRDLGLAVVPIRLPFSSMCALEKRISFDTKLLQQPIQITLTLNNSNKFMSLGSSVINRGNLENSFKQLSFQSYQQGLSDQSLSLRTELLANPRFSVGYPFQYIQDMPFNVLPSQGGKYLVNITSMLNADLTTIQFALLWDEDRQAGGSKRFAPHSYIQMRDIELKLNGQRLHNYDGETYPYSYLSHNIGEYWADVHTAPFIITGGSAETPQRKRQITLQNKVAVYEINFSRLRAQSMEAHMMNTPRFTNQTMQLEFTLDTDAPNFDRTVTDPRLILHTTYQYNAVFMIGQDGGQSKLITA
jgi:hypothetical protein